MSCTDGDWWQISLVIEINVDLSNMVRNRRTHTNICITYKDQLVSWMQRDDVQPSGWLCDLWFFSTNYKFFSLIWVTVHSCRWRYHCSWRRSTWELLPHWLLQTSSWNLNRWYIWGLHRKYELSRWLGFWEFTVLLKYVKYAHARASMGQDLPVLCCLSPAADR